MGAAIPRRFHAASPGQPLQVTLLELVCAVREETEDDREVVATVVHLLRSRRVRLCGNFRDAPIEDFC